jgi:hypothetical protein
MRPDQHVHRIDLHCAETVHDLAERGGIFRRADGRHEQLRRQRDAAGFCER